MDRFNCSPRIKHLLPWAALVMAGCEARVPAPPANVACQVQRPRLLELADMDFCAPRRSDSPRAVQAAYPAAAEAAPQVVDPGQTVEPPGDAAPATITGRFTPPDEMAPLAGAQSDRRDEAGSGDRSELPWARAQAGGPEMAAVVAQADLLVRQGFELAGRGATYAARAKFLAALRTISQALDAEQQTSFYSQALAAGLTAVKESDDFASGSGSIVMPIDVQYVIARHKTSVLKGHRESPVTPLAALQRYYSYAQEQLGAAAGQTSAGSMALYGLGRIATELSSVQSISDMNTAGRAMTFYQAALLADRQNFRAANELGVLLAHAGKHDRAREMFLLSLSVSPQPAAWMNLAAVHQRRGETDLASRARAEALAVQKSVPSTPEAGVRWLDANSFARASGPYQGFAGAAAVSPTPAAVPVQKKQMAGWLPKNQSPPR